MSIPGIGDVVYYKDNKEDKYILIEMLKNWEDAGSMSYDREYSVLPLEKYDADQKVVDKYSLRTIRVTDIKFPFTKVEDEIPFNINKEVIVLHGIERKKAKITYE